MTRSGRTVKVRVTGILIEKDSLLLLDQNVEGTARTWSLPGGKVEVGETLEEAMVREMKEETGLVVSVDKLLYICDLIDEEQHVIHITFALKRQGGSLGQITTGIDTQKIRGVQFVPITQLQSYGFSSKFQKLVQADFPNQGNYMGPKSNIGL